MSSRPDRIDVERARELLQQGRAVVVDARPRRAWLAADAQIPSARHVDAGSGADIDELIDALPRELLLIAYCDEPGHAASAHVARKARERGHGDAVLLEGGFAAWRAAGYPTERRPDATGPAVPFDV